MPTQKLAITLDRRLLKLVDGWVVQGKYPNRSQAIQSALRETVERWQKRRLAEECAKLDPKEERALSDETHSGESWPPYRGARWTGSWRACSTS